MVDQEKHPLVSIPSSLAGKRVCIVCPDAYPLLNASVAKASSSGAGGAEAQLSTIGLALARVGLDVHFIVADCGQAEQVEVGGVTAHRATFRYMGGSKKYVLPDWLRLWRILRRIRADYHLIKVPRHLLFLLGLFCRVHGGHLILIGQKDSDLVESIIRSNEGAKGWWLYVVGMRFVSAVAAQTEVQRLGFQKMFGKDAVVIRNVLTLPDDNDIRKENYVLWAGNSSDDKQPHLVLELARALPDVQFRMIMTLTLRRNDDSFIRDQLSTLPNLEYLGAVPFGEIAGHYKHARLFISTSKCEGFPNTFLQSWQYRTPVVSLLVDPDGVIERHNLGRLSGSLENMVAHIRELYDAAALCDKLGDNSHRYAYEYHSLESAVNGYRNLLAGLDRQR
ncbi:MAG: glycosyltransferase family 4 protein [Sulfuricaulis sp.]|uniref:glycosyltransferase family 4 protein n=1 Tax=Sulfuricaulis sp. TaxID=2003553 RepID=UPI0025F62E58|nr:glycosyltransferase family 4 protein [Sulfuricaulis sp.]MCR4347321.1 glycosyltransferase family 4 protein [Sulfuricaulis sp.]